MQQREARLGHVHTPWRHARKDDGGGGDGGGDAGNDEGGDEGGDEDASDSGNGSGSSGDSGGDGDSHYNPDEPRVPAGNSHGGEWTSDGTNGGDDTADDDLEDAFENFMDGDRLASGFDDSSIFDLNPSGTGTQQPFDVAGNDGAPGDPQRQNKQARDVAVKLGLDRDQANDLHRAISGQNYNYQTILQIGKDIADGTY